MQTRYLKRSSLRLLVIIVCGLMISTLSVAKSAHSIWYQTNKHHKDSVQLRMDLFLSTDCAHCRAADKFFRHVESTHDWLSIHRYYINQDKSALTHFDKRLREQKITMNRFGVPAIFFCDARWVGFNNAQNSGAAILKAATECRKQIIKEGGLSLATIKTLRQSMESNWFESRIETNTSTFFLMLISAFRDALMPYSNGVALVIFLFIYGVTQLRQRVALGTCLLAMVALIHTIQQVDIAFYNQLLHWLHWPVSSVGALLLAYLFIYRHALFDEKGMIKMKSLWPVSMLTVSAVYCVSQDVSPNFSLIFQDYLLKQGSGLCIHVGLIMLYQIVYLLCLALMVTALQILVSRFKINQRFLNRLIGFGLFGVSVYMLYQ